MLPESISELGEGTAHKTHCGVPEFYFWSCMEIKSSSDLRGNCIKRDALRAMRFWSSLQANRAMYKWLYTLSTVTGGSQKSHAKHPVCLFLTSTAISNSSFQKMAHSHRDCFARHPDYELASSLWNELAVSHWAVTLSCWHSEKSLLRHPRWKMIFSSITIYYG